MSVWTTIYATNKTTYRTAISATIVAAYHTTQRTANIPTIATEQSTVRSTKCSALGTTYEPA